MIEGKKIALVVAHPDDAELWAGGLPLRFKDREWTIFCCSMPRRDPIRATQALAAALSLDCSLIRLNHVETDLQTRLPWLDELDLAAFDSIVTHNRFGEYGHLHHIGVHEHIAEKWRDKERIYFGYGIGDTEKTFQIELTDEELDGKWKALGCYRETRQMLVDRFFHGKKEAMRVERYHRA